MPAEKIEPRSSLNRSVLIVDDEGSIRKTLEGVLRDEGFATLSAEDGLSALRLIRERRPDLVLLDIWLPGMDGVETLKQMLGLYPDLAVIMISGHATIATAVMATKLGARDFIEKPLDLKTTVNAIKHVLELNPQMAVARDPASVAVSGKSFEEYLDSTELDSTRLDTIVFKSFALPGRLVTQKTLAGSAVVYGQGLHSGKKSGLVLEPLPAGSGIHFVGVSERTIVPAHVNYVDSTGYATTLKFGQTLAGTIEHLMSALHAYGISNLLVKCNGEVPVMDGSALDFCTLFEDTGLEEQPGEWREIEVTRTLRVGNEREFIQIEPAQEFSVEYTLIYPEPVGRQHYIFALSDVDTYKQEIAPSRTFGFVKDINALQQMGLALGGRFDNFVLIGPEGPLNTELRFADEMVRHKILDVIGDLYLLGRPLRGKVTACMTGHSDNIALLKLLQKEME